MSARRQIIAALSEDSMGGIATLQDVEHAEQLVDAHAAEVLAENGNAAAERDCLALAVLFARQWSGGTPFELHKGIDEILATMPGAGEKSSREADATPALTVYRASHDSIQMGLYTTAAEARKHCETEVRREHSDTSTVKLWWREDEDTVDQPEDGEQELIENVKSNAVPGPGYTRPTGYVVTPLAVASKYDEEADE